MPWQRELIYSLFACDEDGKRQYRWAYLSVGKGNGKTALLASLALWFLCASGEPSPLIVVAAGSDDQAKTLYGACRNIAEDSPTLQHLLECFEDEILCPSIPGGKIKRVSATAKKHSSNLDGLDIYVAICDELHVWEGDRGRNVWGVLTRGTRTRVSPMVLQITTAGYDRESVCYEQYQAAKKAIHDPADDPSYYAYISEAPEDADHTQPDSWRDANPSYGVIQQPSFYEDQLGKQPEFEFRRYFLNQWTDAGESWLPSGAWEACSSDKDIPLGSDIYVGIDAALYSDTTSVVWLHRNSDGVAVMRSKVFTQGEKGVIDLQEVKTFALELCSMYNVIGISYDPKFFELVAQELMDQGVPMVEEPQSPSRMIPACRHAYEQITAGFVAHDSNPDLNAHVKSAAVRAYESGWTLSKGKSKHHIDACIAMVLALWLSENMKAAPQSDWNIYV
jgi:phage terminase large subunit-like protein